MKRKHREAMRAAARERDERQDDADDDAVEARDWHDDWVAGTARHEESNSKERSHQ